MLDINWIKANPGSRLRSGAQRKAQERAVPPAELLAARRTSVARRLPPSRRPRPGATRISKQIGQARRGRTRRRPAALLDEVAHLEDRGAERPRPPARTPRTGSGNALLIIPNLPLEAECRRRRDESDNVEVFRPQWLAWSHGGKEPAREAQLSFPAQGAFRDRRSAGPDGFRGGGQALGAPLRGAQVASWRGSSAPSGSSCSDLHVDDARLHRGGTAISGARRGAVRHQPAAQVRGGPVLRTAWRRAGWR